MKPSTALIICLLAACAGPAGAQTLGQGSRDDIPWLQLASGLGLCLLFAVVAALILRQRLGPVPSGPRPTIGLGGLTVPWISERVRTAQRLSHLETRRLPGSVTVTLMRCDDQEYLITSSPQGHLVVSPVESAASVAAAE